MKLLRSFFALILLFAGPSTVQAMSVTYIVDGIFHDGSTLSGSFDFDPDLGVVPSSEVLTGLGVVPGHTFTSSATYYISTMPNASLIEWADVTRPCADCIETFVLTLLFQSPLTGLPGDSVGFAIHPNCSFPNSGCSEERYFFRNKFLTKALERVVISGSVTAIPIPAVPVPAAFWLFATGLIGLAGISKRVTSVSA